MEESIGFMLNTLEEERAYARHSEVQRSTLVSLIIIVSSAIQGGLTQTGFTKNALPITITLIVLGIFGAIATQKLYERHQFHATRAGKLRRRIEELYPETKVTATFEAARKEHEAKFPILSKKIRLHTIWLTFNILIVVLGLTYTLIAFLR